MGDESFKVIDSNGEEALEITKGSPEVETINIEYIRGRITAYEEAEAQKRERKEYYQGLLAEYEKIKEEK